MALNVLLTYQIHGSFYAYQKNHAQFGLHPVLEMMDVIATQAQSSCEFKNTQKITEP